MFTFDSTDGVTIHVHEWRPGTSPRAVVQIAHGMGEHAGRYAPLAAALVEQGFVVYANDHRGHGLSRHASPGHLGDDGWNRLVGDLAALSAIAHERHPGLPLVLISHSLGSFAAQHYLLRHADLVDAVALTGTTAVDLMLAGQTTDANPLRALNAAFEPARTPFDWLSRDERAVDAYLADPLCGFSLDAQAMGDLAAATPLLADPQDAPAGLPLCVMVGDMDPLNEGLRLSDLLVKRYRSAGVADLTYRTYPGARHELFNETNSQEVIDDLLTWLHHAAL
ncbi:alpha/beta hydrolase [Streptomyces sp. DSM 15324]|uniref:alpha/beta hydrolase n=1 Tax=Streptomyces sp. DSM 15324 TaxID=1739111 RepID=UPI00074912AA|nr:alpha/beta hydrolase [Streptomyces sp. DSM 15324]KUO07389.1 alpha/beta hydrolase [Streptomyces sp. DSM 15324]